MLQKVMIEKNDKGYISIKLFGARTSFAFLNEPKSEKNGTKKFSSEFLLPENAEGGVVIKKVIADFGRSKFEKGFKASILKIGNAKIADMIGDVHNEADLSHYKDMVIISANTNAEKPPKKLGGPFYSGCYVAV